MQRPLGGGAPSRVSVCWDIRLAAVAGESVAESHQPALRQLRSQLKIIKEEDGEQQYLFYLNLTPRIEGLSQLSLTPPPGPAYIPVYIGIVLYYFLITLL